MKAHGLKAAPWAVCFAFLLLAGPAPWHGARAAQLKTLYSFCQQQNCIDGKFPMGGLLMDGSGDLFGTTSVGGSRNHGTVFELVANANKTSWTYALLYNFCSVLGCPDGDAPVGSLIRDKKGNLYGVTQKGGADNQGIVFELVPDGTTWKLLKLYVFCAETQCADGAQPMTRLTYAGDAAGLPYDGKSPLYGTTMMGGAANFGTVFMLKHVKKRYQHELLYSFCTNGSANCTDAEYPNQPFLDANGNIFGVTCCGGPADTGGAAWELVRGKGGKFTEQTIFQFDGDSPSPTGEAPESGFVQGADGLLFSVTRGGGGNAHDVKKGVLYSLKLNGKSPATENVLYGFCSLDNCTDGESPLDSTPILDPMGVLYGTTINGGIANLTAQQGAGVLYKFKPSYSVLYSFCSASNCTDGAYPSNVIMDGSGALFGTTQAGGTGAVLDGAGTVFEFVP